MRAVAEQLGIRAPSLYKHVQGKADLELAVMVSALEELVVALEAAAGRRPPAVGLAYRCFALEHPGPYRLLTARPLPRDRLPAGSRTGRRSRWSTPSMGRAPRPGRLGLRPRHGRPRARPAVFPTRRRPGSAWDTGLHAFQVPLAETGARPAALPCEPMETRHECPRAGGGLAQAEELGLDRAGLVRMHHHMLLTRGLEDRGTSLFKQGKLPGSFYTGRGNEAASVGVASAMAPGDVGAPLHRNMGVHVARGAEPWRLLCQYMGRDGGATRGRDSNLRSQDLTKGLIAGVSHLPGILPTALGVALAFRITGQPNVALGWFGDGASARGDVHECMNFAAVRRLPMVFICDNNQYAYSTPTNLNYACEHLADRASSYGFEGVVVDGTDILAVYREAQAALLGPQRRRPDDARAGRRCAWTATPSTTTRATCRPSCTPRGSRARPRSRASSAWLRRRGRRWTTTSRPRSTARSPDRRRRRSSVPRPARGRTRRGLLDGVYAE